MSIPDHTRRNTMYHLDHFAYSFPENQNTSNKGDSYLHRTKCAVLNWTFKTTYTYGKVTITKYSSKQAVQMGKSLTQLLHGKLPCHKPKIFCQLLHLYPEKEALSTYVYLHWLANNYFHMHSSCSSLTQYFVDFSCPNIHVPNAHTYRAPLLPNRGQSQKRLAALYFLQRYMCSTARHGKKGRIT